MNPLNYKKQTHNQKHTIMEITTETALHFAELWGLTFEVESFIQKGYTPKEALEEWDCLPTEKEIVDYLSNI